MNTASMQSRRSVTVLRAWRVLAFSTRPPRQLRNFATRRTRFRLNTGASIPAIGFGTFQDPDAQTEAVSSALKAGLRLIDTARVYDVEKQVGEGIRASGVPREDIFIGTKLWCNSFHPDDVEKALEESLTDLGTPYAMEKLVKAGKAKAIGVSNFSKGELQKLITETSTVPAVHQMEVHPYLQQTSFNEWLRSQGIHVIQFSPLGNMNDFYRQTGWSKEVAHMTRVIDQPLLKDLGQKYGKSAVQIVLSWGINNGHSVIPKSTIAWQIKENVEADFELEPEDVKAIETLDMKARFNDPSLDYGWRLYSDLEGIEGTKDGKTH
ncbi:hypothetical protein G7046_g3006 [Stylonectria norvegica]|nr:hypothetical protein G7046_g3006 [Stylonectria norvegica]